MSTKLKVERVEVIPSRTHVSYLYDGDAPKLSPFLLVRNSKNDDGLGRDPTGSACTVGPNSPDIWFEPFSGGIPSAPVVPIKDNEYQVVARVANLGRMASYMCTVRFLEWLRTDPGAHVYDEFYMTTVVVHPGSNVEVRTTSFAPGRRGLFPGGIMVEVSDAMFDPFVPIGTMPQLRCVNQNRHLAHRYFP